jgi:hypothetical protein
MTHTAKEALVALADGELDAVAEARTLGHVQTCSACSAALAEVNGTRATLAGALRALDAAEPPEWATATATGADGAPALPLVEIDGPVQRAAEPAVLDIRRPQARRAPSRRAPRRSAPPALRWAAGILLAGAAAAAVLREPLLEALRGEAAPPVQTESVAPAQTPQPRGMFVTPVDGAVDIVLVDGAAGTRIDVAYHARPDVLVASTSAQSPLFTEAPGRLRAELAGARHDLRIVVPEALRRVRILAGDEELAVIEAGRLTRSAADRGYVIEAEAPGR